MPSRVKKKKKSPFPRAGLDEEEVRFLKESEGQGKGTETEVFRKQTA